MTAVLPTTEPQPGTVAGPPRDTRARAVLVLALVLTALYAAQLIVNVCRPNDTGEATVGVLSDTYPAQLHATFWAVISGWIVAAVLAPVAVAAVRAAHDPQERARRRHRWQLGLAAVLLVPFAMYPLFTLGQHMEYAVACVPSTVFALWTVHRMQRHRRMPVRLLLAVFAWGALIGGGFGASMNIWVMDSVIGYAPVSLNMLKTMHTVYSCAFLSAGISEELGKGAGVAIAYLLFRRYFDNVVSGIVLGAAAGLGFNFCESVEYMSNSNGLGAGFQYFSRQSVGLMAAHTAFSAAVGAGFGIARQLADPRRRRLAIGCGYVAAAGGHFANDALLRYFGQHPWARNPGQWMQVGLITPGQLLALQGPFVLLYLWLLRSGLRDQRSALGVELDAEARSGHGAVTLREVPALLSPARRLRKRVDALRRGGADAYRELGRLYAAQLDLGMQLWHRSRGESDPWAVPEPELRRRVLLMKHARLVPYLPAGNIPPQAPPPGPPQGPGAPPGPPPGGPPPPPPQPPARPPYPPQYPVQVTP